MGGKGGWRAGEKEGRRERERDGVGLGFLGMGRVQRDGN
jgi:hypothetical protein